MAVSVQTFDLSGASTDGGGNSPTFSDEQRRNFDVCVAMAHERAKAAALRSMYRNDPPASALLKRADRLERGGALTAAERMRKHVALTNELHEIPAPVNPEWVEECRNDFPLFVERFGGVLLKHPPSKLMVEKFLKALERSVLVGGQLVVEMPRGKGKSTFIILCCAWATAFGHRKFIVVVAATDKFAKKNLARLRLVYESPAFAAAFPAISKPLKALGGKWQLAESQTYNGNLTCLEAKTDHIRLPTLIGADGNTIGDAAGALIYCVGVGGAVRGLVDGANRPDMVFGDDIQKRKDAKSPSLSEALEEFVDTDLGGLFGHDSPKTMLLAITPICEGDFASLITDKERNPAWVSIIVPLVIKWPEDTDLVNRFIAEYREDSARDDMSLTLSTAFYREHQADLWRGCVLLDDGDGGPGEIDALHHVLNLLASRKREAFDSEFQMRVREEGGELEITPDIVKHRVNGVPQFVVPDCCDGVVGFCDVNIQKGSGLRYGLMAVGSGRVTAMVTYGRYPRQGRLFPEDTPEASRGPLIAAAVRLVGKILNGQDAKDSMGNIKARGITVTDERKRVVRPLAVVFDGGNWTQQVARACKILREVDHLPTTTWSLGRNWSQFNDVKAKTKYRRGDHMFIAKSKNGEHIVFHSDYWREVMQSSFVRPPLTDCSCSLYGSDPVAHDEAATEICNEKLIRTFIRPDGRKEWDWKLKSKMNHYGDVFTGCFVTASWFRLYDSEEKMIDRAAAKVTSRPTPGAAAPGSDRAEMEAELADYLAAHPEASGESAAVQQAVAPAVRRPAKKRFHFSKRLKR